MNVLNFIKSLFVPSKMKPFRTMSVFFAICIFILCMYAVIFPAKVYYDNNTHKLISENDLYYMHVLYEFPTVGEEVDEFVSGIKSKELSSIDGVMTAGNMKVSSARAVDSIVGVVEEKDGNYYFNGKDTGIVKTDAPLSFKISSYGLIMNNVDNKPIDCEFDYEKDFKVVTLTVNKRAKLVIDGSESDILITDDFLDCFVANGYLYVNGQKTSKEVTPKEQVIIEFLPATEITYYEKQFSYTSQDGVNNHFTFIVDLDISNISGIVAYKYDENIHKDLDKNSYYYIIVTKGFVFYQANLQGINELEIERDSKKLQFANLSTYYANSPFSTLDFTTETFGTYLSGKLEEGYKVLAVQSFNITAFMYCIVYTFIISLLFSFLFRKNGRMKKLKEYYNIASIANIVPTIICFIINWFFPLIFAQLYLFIFAVYFLFVLYKINNGPEAV